MKPNEYKTYRKLEQAVAEFLSSMGEETAQNTDWTNPSSLFLAEGAGELVRKVSDILARTLTAEDETGLLAMVRDEVKDGTIDFTDLGRYQLYREEIPEPLVQRGVQDTAAVQDDCLSEETVRLIRSQLAEISLIEHRLARMKEELLLLADKLGL